MDEGALNLRVVLAERHNVHGLTAVADRSGDWVFMPRGGLTEAEGLRFAANVRQAYRGPDGKARLSAWEERLAQWAAEGESKAAGIDWPRLGSEDVVALTIAAHEADVSCRLMVGIEGTGQRLGEDAIARQWFARHLLWYIDPARPRLLCEVLFLEAVGGSALAEYARRLEGHVGRWPMLAELESRGGAPYLLPHALENLRRLVSSNLGVLGWMIGRDEETGATDSRHALDSAIDGQAFVTIKKRTASASLAELLMRAVEGQLNILPKAIANAMLDSRAHEQLNPVSTAGPLEVEGEDGEIRIVVEPASGAQADPRTNLTEDQLLAAYLRGPHRTGAEAALGRPDPRLSEPTIKRRIADFRAALGAPRRRRGRPKLHSKKNC